MAPLTDDGLTPGGTTLTARQALALIASVARPVTGSGPVPLGEATGRFLADDVVAPVDVPPHDNAAVDGYALRHADLAPEGETVLPVTGRVAAGHPPERPVGPGEAVRIFTGAPVPPGTDTIVMQEDVRLDGDRVAVPAGPRAGANLRRAGEDVRRGATILAAGRRLRPQDIGLAAAVGLTRLPCRMPLRVAAFSTGDELVETGEPLPLGAIHDANRHGVMALLRRLGLVVTDLGILADRGDRTRAALAAAARDHHALVTSGGVSVGEVDHVGGAVAELGRLDAWRLAIKPGRHLLLGRIGKATVVGLPGNPVAALVTLLRFGRPLLLRLAGATDPEPTLFAVRAGFGHAKKVGRREYLRVALRRAPDGVLEAHAVARQGSGVLSSMVEADGLAELPEDMTRLEKGEMIEVLPFSEVIG